VEPCAHRGEAGPLPLAPRVLGAYRAHQQAVANVLSAFAHRVAPLAREGGVRVCGSTDERGGGKERVPVDRLRKGNSGVAGS